MDTGSGKTHIAVLRVKKELQVSKPGKSQISSVRIESFSSLYNSLALIVFDEGSKFMQDFYWSKKISKEPVPHILGLTASPVMGSNWGDLEILESILDATCKRPRK
ncbi:hypothetical protein F5882DRAFT_384168 [Hyaloscypha sp. PMI_1271]|nr:hypothetical protein F5882DRAFT_384168 [Hyaloscypha sp. PMI_1271]